MKKYSGLLVSLLVAALVFVTFRLLIQPSKKANVETPSTTETIESLSTTDNTPSEVQSQPQTLDQGNRGTTNFTFTPPAPVNGKLQGIVELGASGFNSFIINVDPSKNWKLEKAEYGASLVYENMATDEDVRSGLKKYISNMLNFGVGPKDIHFMVSSSAIQSEEVQKIRKGLKSLGYVVNAVTAEQEGKFALASVLPKAFEENAFVVDIGSGNTKISWKSQGSVQALETYGSKYFQNKLSDDQVSKEVRALVIQIPEGKRKTCFIIGGAPFDLAKTHRNGKERYTVLKKVSEYSVKEEKTKAGLNIIDAIAKETGCDTFVFDWDANFTIGFLLSL